MGFIANRSFVLVLKHMSYVWWLFLAASLLNIVARTLENPSSMGTTLFDPITILLLVVVVVIMHFAMKYWINVIKRESEQIELDAYEMGLLKK